MKFKVFTIPHTIFAAAHLVEQLNDLGHQAELIGKLDPKDTAMHIIYNPAVIRHPLPKNYIVYQTEIGTSKWFNAHYLNIIQKAVAVWDYSPVNVIRYQQYNKCISIVTPGVWEQEQAAKDIPVTFYGWVKGSARRHQLLTEINKSIPVNVVTNSMGNEMWKILRRTKVVLNLHFYNNSPLEVFRVNEALSFGCQVVSEPPAMVRYKGLVHFETGADKLMKRLKKAVEKEVELSLERLDNTEELRKAIADLPHFKSLSSASSSPKDILRKV